MNFSGKEDLGSAQYSPILLLLKFNPITLHKPHHIVLPNTRFHLTNKLKTPLNIIITIPHQFHSYLFLFRQTLDLELDDLDDKWQDRILKV